MKKLLFIVFTALLFVFSANASFQTVNYDTKFDKTPTKIYQNNGRHGIKSFEKDYRKVYHGSRPIEIIDRWEDWSDYDDRRRDYYNMRDRNGIAPIGKYVHGEYKYRVRNHENHVTDRSNDRREFSERNRHKIDYFRSNGRTFRSSDRYAVNDLY